MLVLEGQKRLHLEGLQMPPSPELLISSSQSQPRSPDDLCFRDSPHAESRNRMGIRISLWNCLQMTERAHRQQPRK